MGLWLEITLKKQNMALQVTAGVCAVSEGCCKNETNNFQQRLWYSPAAPELNVRL